jgi:DNA polymerase-1
MKLLAIDGNSIVNRAFFGIRPLSGPDGTPTNAIYGFLSMVDRLKNEIHPDMIAVAFDVHQPTFRHEVYDEYKAGRNPMPDELRVQIPLLKDMLRDFGIPVLECPGYEADDILGTLSRRCMESGDECYLYTGDRDSFQLISDWVYVCFPKSSPTGTQNIMYDKARIAEEFGGLSPSQLIDVKGLQGDSSDNITGVIGIGPKTAVSLIAKYGSINNIYDNLDNLPESEKLRTKLRNGKEDAFFSKMLGTICCDAPIGVCLDDLHPNRPDMNAVYDDLSSLGLNRFIQSWGIEREEVEIE